MGTDKVPNLITQGVRGSGSRIGNPEMELVCVTGSASTLCSSKVKATEYKCADF